MRVKGQGLGAMGPSIYTRSSMPWAFCSTEVCENLTIRSSMPWAFRSTEVCENLTICSSMPELNANGT